MLFVIINLSVSYSELCLEVRKEMKTASPCLVYFSLEWHQFNYLPQIHP